jgi:hypothetical protein
MNLDALGREAGASLRGQWRAAGLRACGDCPDLWANRTPGSMQVRVAELEA